MKINIPIEAEREIIKYAKELIKGQVKALVREELAKVVNEEAARLLAGDNDMKALVRDAAKHAAKTAVARTPMGKMVEEFTEDKIKNIIQGMAKEEIRVAFANELGAAIREYLGPILAEKTIEIQLGDKMPEEKTFPGVLTTVELMYSSDPDNAEQVIAFIGEHNIPKCDKCGGTGEYEGEHGPVGCQLCVSRLIPFIDANGEEQHLDWGDVVQNTNGMLFKKEADDAGSQ